MHPILVWVVKQRIDGGVRLPQGKRMQTADEVGLARRY
jgi:hypothetical protein